MSKDNIVLAEIIPLDAIIDLKIKGEFVARLNQFINESLVGLCKDENHKNEILDHIKKGTNTEDPYVYHITTIISLYAAIEAEAKAQKLTKTVKINKDTGELVKD